MSAAEWLVVLGWGTVVGLIFTIGVAGAPRVWSALRGTKRRRWGMASIRCNKCGNQEEPGVLRYEAFNPMTEDVDVTKVLCDRCEGTGYIKIILVDDDVKPSEWNEVRSQIESEVDLEEIQIHTIRRESEVEGDYE